MANYRLFIQKRYYDTRGSVSLRFALFFSVIDLDKGIFPFNFICILPKEFRDTYYCKFFPDSIKGLLLAKQLLKEAKKEYVDPDIHKEINFRLGKIEVFLNSLLQKHRIELFHCGK